MEKNHLLLVLACLNCVHTTHAVEQTTVNTQMQESLDKLQQQYYLQKLRMTAGQTKEDFEMLRDAAIQAEEIMEKVYAHKQNELSPDDQRRYYYDVLRSMRRAIITDLSNLQADDSKAFSRLTYQHRATHIDIRLNDKIREWFNDGKITGLDVNPQESLPYVKALRRAVPDLPMWITPNNVRLGELFGHPVDRRPDELGQEQLKQEKANEYPDIAEQRRDLYRKSWVHQLNSGIKKEDPWIGNIEAKIPQLDALNTEIARDVRETIASTLRDNLLGEDQDLKERTVALLERAPALTRMVFDGPEMEKMLTDSKIRSMRRMEHFKKNANFANARGLEELLVKKPLVTEHIAIGM